MGLPIQVIKKSFLFLLWCAFTPLFSVSITLYNDSNYPLNAQIIDATGRHLALIPLKAGQTYIYDISQGAFDPNTNQPYTPLTVIFLCKSARPYDYMQKKKKPNKNDIPNKSEYVNQFGIWTGVARGSMVTALGSPTGSKSCVMKKNPNIKGKGKSSSFSNSGANNWSNDGGQNWTNDDGSGPGSCTDDGLSCSGGRKKKGTTATKKEDAFENDGGENWNNDDSNKSAEKENTPPSGKWTNDGGKTWTNDKDSSKDKHIPSKRTPLPFVERE